VMFAVALGPAIGGAALRFGTRAPFYAAAALAAMVALAAIAAPSALSRASNERRTPRLGFAELARTEAFLAPAVLAFAERFTVGCFVVTFALYAHDVRHLSDARTSICYSAMLLPFALATYPFARDTARFSRGALVSVGSVLYGVTFLAFGFASGPALVGVLGLAGLASAMVYGPSLCWVVTAGGRAGRATSMAMFHAAGCVGMLLGPAFAGVLSSVLRHAGADSASRYAAIFVFAGLVQLACVFAIRKPLARLRATDSNVTCPQPHTISVQREGSRS